MKPLLVLSAVALLASGCQSRMTPAQYDNSVKITVELTRKGELTPKEASDELARYKTALRQWQSDQQRVNELEKQYTRNPGM